MRENDYTIAHYSIIYKTCAGRWVCSPMFKGVGPLRVFNTLEEARQHALLIQWAVEQPGKTRPHLKKISNRDNTRRWVPNIDLSM